MVIAKAQAVPVAAVRATVAVGRPTVPVAAGRATVAVGRPTVPVAARRATVAVGRPTVPVAAGRATVAVGRPVGPVATRAPVERAVAKGPMVLPEAFLHLRSMTATRPAKEVVAG